MAQLTIQDGKRIRRLREAHVTTIQVRGDRFDVEVTQGETVAVLQFSRLEAIAIVASLRDEIGHAEEIRESAYRVVDRRDIGAFSRQLAEVG